jgi:hypothetical protein
MIKAKKIKIAKMKLALICSDMRKILIEGANQNLIWISFRNK